MFTHCGGNLKFVTGLRDSRCTQMCIQIFAFRGCYCLSSFILRVSKHLTVTHIPRVGIVIGNNAFDLSNLYSRREVNHLFLLILTIIFRPGVGILIIFVRKCQNPHPMPDPLPPLGIDIDRYINISINFQSNATPKSDSPQ